jgi:hypothetical protein
LHYSTLRNLALTSTTNTATDEAEVEATSSVQHINSITTTHSSRSSLTNTTHDSTLEFIDVSSTRRHHKKHNNKERVAQRFSYGGGTGGGDYEQQQQHESGEQMVCFYFF